MYIFLTIRFSIPWAMSHIVLNLSLATPKVGLMQITSVTGHIMELWLLSMIGKLLFIFSFFCICKTMT